jgi:hypothetical protein
MIDPLRTRIGRAFRRTALPLAAYYVVTLAIPFANGAARSGMAFVEHALVVLVVPPLLIALACVGAQLFARDPTTEVIVATTRDRRTPATSRDAVRRTRCDSATASIGRRRG